MAASPTHHQVNAAAARAVKRLFDELKNEHAVKHCVYSGQSALLQFSSTGSHKIEINAHVVRASNGEVAVWPTAEVIVDWLPVVMLDNAPWMEDGCNAANIRAQIKRWFE
jgi:hypothetical protein